MTQAQSELLEITVNGNPKKVLFGGSVRTLLDALSVSPDRVAVELNGSIVRKRDWDQTIIPEGSRIEIVEFVGGG